MRNQNGNCNWCFPKCYPRFPSSLYLNPGCSENPNPGNIEDLHSLTKQIMPTFFDGVEWGLRHSLAADKTLTMRWILSHTRPSGLRIGGVYSSRSFDDVLQTPIIFADVNPSSLSSNITFIYYPSSNLRLGLDLQKSIISYQKTLLAELYSGSTTYSINVYNPSKERGRCTFSFLRSVSRHCALGTELLIQWNDPKYMSADLALAMRYSRHNYSTALTFSRKGFDISYWQRIHTSIQMGSSLVFNGNTREAIASICYQWEFQDTTVRGMLDSNMSVGFIYHRTLAHIPCTFGLSVLFGIPSNRLTFGIKFDLDPCINCK